jgi:hypothetical protein
MQSLIILIALATTAWFSILLAKHRRGPRGLLIFSVLDLAFVAAYEIYMYAIWEKTVHAPIRLDIFVLELPLLVLGIVGGIVGTYRLKSFGALR